MTHSRAKELDLAAFVVNCLTTEWASFRDHYPHCEPCAWEAARWTRLMNTLRDETARPPAEHPAEEKLLRFQSTRSSLPAAEQQRIEQHLTACASCRSELKLLQSFDFEKLDASAPQPQRVVADAQPSLIGLPAAWVAWNPQA